MRRFFAALFAAWISVFVWTASFAHAATITPATVSPTTLQASTAANHTFLFTTPTGVTEGQTMTLTFDAPFDTSTIVEDDVDVLDDGVAKTTATTCAGTEQASVAMAADVLTVTLCAGDGGAIGATSQVMIRIGTNAVDSGTGTHRITNPSAAAVHYVTVGGTFGDFGSFALAIGGDDSVAVSTSVTTGGAGTPSPTPSVPPPSENTPPAVASVLVTNITASSATVNFTTDEAATSKVEYGSTVAYGADVSSGTFAQTHTWPLSALTEGTTYHFRIITTDTSNNVSTSSDFTFTTLDVTPPVISGIAVTGITQTQASVTWTTNEWANATVEYGATNAYGSIATVATYIVSHDVPLTGLTAGTLYHYRVKSADASGNETVSADGTFTTLADLPPGNVSALILTPGIGSVALSWTNPLDTDLTAIRVLRCTDAPPSGANDVTGCVVASEGMEIMHTYGGLTAGHTYYFGVFAKDAAGQFSSGTLGSAIPFGADVPPGIVKNFRARTGDSHLLLAWTNPSDGDLAGIRVLACTTALPSGASSTEDCAIIFDGMGTSFDHTGLVNGQTYYFGAYARDAAGQFSVGAFTTGMPLKKSATVTETDTETKTGTEGPLTSASAFVLRSGDTRVIATWTNPPQNTLAAMRLIACTSAFPSAPTDLSGGCSLVYEGLAETFTHTGLMNGQTYYYGLYAKDTEGQYSMGVFRSATPSALIPQCGDNICNGEETPLSCALDCGAKPPACGNASCEAGETALSCPADCGLIPTCGNGMCEAGETSLICPSDCAVQEPQPTTEQEHLIGWKEVDVFVQEGKVRLNPTAEGFDFLAGKDAVIRLLASKLPKPAERIQITLGQEVFNLALITLPDGTKAYQAQLPIPAQAGRFATSLGLVYQDGKAQTLSLVSHVQGYGLIYEQKNGDHLALSQAVVTLLEGAKGDKAWDAVLYGQENPRITGSAGTYGWYVPNGSYRIRVEKAGYRTETIKVQTQNNLVGQDIRLHLDQPLVPTVLEAVTDLRADPQVQQAADVTLPTVVAVATANAASLAVGFNLLAYLRYLSTAPVLLFSRRRRKGFGVVYNAITKVPVDLAIVRLYLIDEANPTAMGRLVASRVTDKGGRYFFLAQPGSYRLTATKPGFLYPTKYLEKVKDDGLFMDVYHQEFVRVAATSSIAVNIPVDPIQATETPTRIRWMRRFRFAQNTVAVLGNIGAVAVFFLRPSVFTASMAGGQVLLYALIRRLTSPKKPISWGIVYDVATGRPLSNVIARIFEPKYNKLLETAMTDSRGRYTFLLGPNEYYAVFEKQGFQTETVRPIDYSKKTEPSDLSVKVAMKQGENPIPSGAAV